MHMSAPHGNQFALRYKTSEERQDLCRRYCGHIEKGYSDESFPDCDIDTLKRYITEHPEDFGADVGRSKRLRQLFWERAGVAGTLGQIKGFNAKSWTFNMQNRFRWADRQDVASDNKMNITITRGH